MFNLYFDGASKQNPGPAGCGWYLQPRDQDPDKEIKGYKSLGRQTNNYAEYMGLIEGLKAAKAAGIKQLIIQGDSKLIIEQMKGLWKVKAPGLMPLHAEAKELSKNFEIKWGWIPRSMNKVADHLANQSFN